MSLLKAETDFRMLKSALGLRPNHHQLENRVDGHIFISVLAYHLLNWIRSLRRSPRMEHHPPDPAHPQPRQHAPAPRRRAHHHLRKPSNPDAEQARIYTALGINPKTAYTPVRSEVAM
jgi:hypothetical protein